MYNISYIREFSENDYINALNDNNKLSIIANEYNNKNNGKCNALYLAFKESLDHYVLYKIMSDNKYIYTKEFINYKTYIYNIFKNNKLQLNSNIYCNMEFNTNIVLKNPNIRKIIFDTYFNKEEDKIIIEKNTSDISNRLKYYYNLLDKNDKLNMAQLTFLGEYFNNTKDFENSYYKKYIEYILNKVPKDKIVTIPIINSILSYLPYVYKNDNRVADTRMFICSHDSNNLNYSKLHVDTVKYKTQSGDTFRKIAKRFKLDIDYLKKMFPKKYNEVGPDGILPENKTIIIINGNDFANAHSSGSKKYCCFRNSLLSQASFGDESLNYNRNTDNNDLFFWIYVAFHELTHQHQKYESSNLELNSSGLAYIINNIFRQDLCDYSRNHDSSELEIEADENGWANTLAFLHQYIGFSKLQKDNDSIKHDYYGKCLTNIDDVHARRAFSYKIDEKGEAVFYAKYDLDNLKIMGKNNPGLITQFPMLNKIFTIDGNLKPDIILEEKIMVDDSRFEENYGGIEIGAFLLENHNAYNLLKQRLIKSTLSREELENIRSNLYHVCHQNILKLRELSKIKPEVYSQTTSHFDFNNLDKLKNIYFKNLFIILFRVRDLQIIMQQKDSYYNYEEEFKKYYMRWFIEASKYIEIYSKEKLKKFILNYENSNDDCLLKLAEYSREYLMPNIEDEITQVSFPSFDELKDFVLNYFVDVDINNPGSILVKNRSNNELVTDESTYNKVIFANIWLNSAGVKYMSNDVINGYTYAFSDKSKQVYEVLFKEIMSNIALNQNFSNMDLMDRLNSVISYKYNNEIINNLFRTNFQKDFIYNFLKSTQIQVKSDSLNNDYNGKI